MFGQVSKALLADRLKLSLGARNDFNTWSSSMSNFLKQISPRFSASYSLREKLNLNFNAGRYFQLPPYTALGYADKSGNFVNKDNNLKYIQADHLVAGLEFIPSENNQRWKDFSRIIQNIRSR